MTRLEVLLLGLVSSSLADGVPGDNCTLQAGAWSAGTIANLESAFAAACTGCYGGPSPPTPSPASHGAAQRRRSPEPQTPARNQPARKNAPQQTLYPPPSSLPTPHPCLGSPKPT